jgi:hypothetical protein
MQKAFCKKKSARNHRKKKFVQNKKVPQKHSAKKEKMLLKKLKHRFESKNASF